MSWFKPYKNFKRKSFFVLRSPFYGRNFIGNVFIPALERKWLVKSFSTSNRIGSILKWATKSIRHAVSNARFGFVYFPFRVLFFFQTHPITRFADHTHAHEERRTKNSRLNDAVGQGERFLILCLGIILSSCAQMGEPTGGELDDTAPQTIKEKTFPANHSVNFGSDKIIITFDEYVSLKNPQVNITPAMDKKPTMKVKGKRIEIQLNEKPASNTTYTINLSGAIADIHEGKTVQNLQYVFSTGPYLDSLSISGKVSNAFTQNGVSSTTVILHSSGGDSAILKQKPAYFLKTDRDGSFRFSNLKQGQYRVYALNDKNADMLFNGFPEEIAFLDSAINLQKNVTELKLLQFKPSATTAKLSSSASLSKWVQRYTWSHKIDNINIRAIKGIEPEKFVVLKTHPSDSVFMVHTLDTLVRDTILFELLAGEKIIDTLNFTAHLSRKMTSKALFKLNLAGELYVTDSIFISSNMPFVYDLSKINITDTLHKTQVKFTVKEAPLGLKIFPQKQNEKVPLKILALPGSFTATLSRIKSDTLKGNTTYLPEEKMGSIELKFQGIDELNYKLPMCVLLLDGKFVMQKRIEPKNPKAEFNLLKPGNYTFYVYDDLNGDDVWTPGNFLKKEQPEKIKWYTQPVKVKANWQQDLTWIL